MYIYNFRIKWQIRWNKFTAKEFRKKFRGKNK